MFRRSLPPVLALAVLCAGALAQQFVRQPGSLPGAVRWTEGVTLADIDADGDLDVLLAEGDGFASAGPKRQNVLLRNELVEQGSLSFVDESVARLGVHLSNAKGVEAADVNGDGFLDLLFSNAFNTDPPFLYINRGAAQPGFFDMQSVQRGLGEALSSAAAQFGDLDDDGDLDLILCDSGNSFLGGAGAAPRLFFNDGDGFFTEDAAALGAPVKVAHMDLQLFDVDGDWDLDFLGTNRASNSGGLHYLMLNDGTGQFSDVSNLIPATSTLTYEIEPADLDLDGDQDLFSLSQTGFQEGIFRSDLIETGSLGFTTLTPLNQGTDDNEIALIDYDMDGDLDVLIGSLGSRERMIRNDGALGLSNVSNMTITGVSDSTLDLAVGDLDGDGAYDIVTVQGESNSAEWGNKLYLNTGPVDSLAPKVLATQVPATAAAFPLVARARIQDQVRDDGVHYVTSSAHYVALAGQVTDVSLAGGVFAPADVTLPPGTRVRFTNNDAGAETVASTTAPYDYALDLAGQGGSADFVFVRPGVYDYVAQGGGATGRVTITGSPARVAGFDTGGSQFRYALTCIPVETGAIALELSFVDVAGNESVHASEVIPYSGMNTVGSAYCTSSEHSGGERARLCATGSAAVSDDDVTLRVTRAAAGRPGIFFYGPAALETPFGDGTRCVGGAFVRRLQPPVPTDGAGNATQVLALTQAPAAADITAQVPITMRFQYWVRDGGSSTNLTDGLAIDFR